MEPVFHSLIAMMGVAFTMWNRKASIPAFAARRNRSRGILAANIHCPLDE
jgi:hypothetical protein